jgi:hypothetical protein
VVNIQIVDVKSITISTQERQNKNSAFKGGIFIYLL